MPITLAEAQSLSPRECLKYLSQLSRLDLGFLDSNFVGQLMFDRHIYGSAYGDIMGDSLRTLIIQERRNLKLIIEDNIIQALRPWIRDDSYSGEPLFQPSLPGMGEESRKKKHWEKLFLYEEKQEDPINDLGPTTQQYNGILVPEDSISNMGYTLKQIAALLPPGVLGAHMKGEEVHNLVYRAGREADPRKKILKGTEWFEVRGEEGVLWAAPTLEAYSVLEETGLEFVMSPRVRRWNSSVDPQWTGDMEWKEGCPLFDYQKDAVSFMWGRDRAMLSLSPGLGKTLTSAYAAGVRNKIMGDVKKILLVCPASLLYYWEGELEKWGDNLPYRPVSAIWHKLTFTLPFDIAEDCQYWVITNPETVVRNQDAFRQGFDLAIYDESIMYKHRESKRSQVMNNLARDIKNVWLLTGAPATRYLDDMWHQFHMLNNRGYSSFWRFAERYCIVDEDVWGKAVLANRKGAEKEIKQNFADVYFARNQDQVANIPDWLMEDINIPMKPKQDAVYAKLQKEMLISLEGYSDDDEIKVTNRLSMILRSLQVASNPALLGAENSSGKWAALPELMDIYPGPYIVWVNFIRTGEMLLEALIDKFGENSVRLANGSTSMEDRNKIVNAFQEGKYEAIVLNSTVGKFGFTLTKARTAFFVERGYDDSYFQCLHRNRRIGTAFSPVIVNMRSITIAGKKTIDHVVHDALDYRNSMIKKITIGDLRGMINE